MILHPPARLQIAAVLAAVSEAEFAKLREVTGVSDSVLSKHLAALSEPGYIKLRKAPANGRQRTWASLTRKGRKAFTEHVAALNRIMSTAGLADTADQKV
ncbi:MarR family transcripitonal regulator [Novosphingobium malaysiense]|uniref:MarR family transcripitonal regulator n=2 Tax=Novosphingobium malaysiense TaxID=1348853 RepID=A0A0B1ZHV0_9SPHN|nr:MarR family transcripitonal regulator [Novosphingobium malaysiense]